MLSPTLSVGKKLTVKCSWTYVWGGDYCSVRAELVSQEHPAKKSSTDVAAQMLMNSLKPKEDNRLCMVENEYTYDDCNEEWEA